MLLSGLFDPSSSKRKYWAINLLFQCGSLLLLFVVPPVPVIHFYQFILCAPRNSHRNGDTILYGIHTVWYLPCHIGLFWEIDRVLRSHRVELQASPDDPGNEDRDQREEP
jgi:hypothetical protein